MNEPGTTIQDRCLVRYHVNYNAHLCFVNENFSLIIVQGGQKYSKIVLWYMKIHSVDKGGEGLSNHLGEMN